MIVELSTCFIEGDWAYFEIGVTNVWIGVRSPDPGTGPVEVWSGLPNRDGSVKLVGAGTKHSHLESEISARMLHLISHLRKESHQRQMLKEEQQNFEKRMKEMMPTGSGLRLVRELNGPSSTLVRKQGNNPYDVAWVVEGAVPEVPYAGGTVSALLRRGLLEEIEPGRGRLVLSKKGIELISWLSAQETSEVPA